MTNLNLNQAREWAEEYKGFDHLTNRVKAAIDTIQSLPDQWVDVEKVRDLIELYKHARDANAPGAEGWVINDLVIGNLEDLLSPKLPTLADMTQEEREACQWMQADWASFDGRESERVIVVEGHGKVITRKAEVYGAALSSITPRPDLPKLQWPGSDPDDVAYATGGVLTTQDVVDECRAVRKERALPLPKDVPANEPWLIEVGGQKAISTRCKRYTFEPWAVAALDGAFANDAEDRDVTLIHKLVPEPPALPEGMRLADHEKYGRVVVSPETDIDGDYKAFHSDPENITGAAWKYVRESELTFLDDKHAGEKIRPRKLSTQQDYRNAPVGTVVKASGDEGRGLNVIVKDAENMWTNTSLGLCRTDFNMSGDIREVVTVIEVK